MAFRTALSPSHGVEPWAERPRTTIRQREHALGLDADVQVGRLAGDREVADVAAGDQLVGRAVSMSSDSSSGTHTKRTRTCVLVGEVAHRAHHRGEPALHVVGAAADQAVALDARRELLRVPGDDVEVAVEDERRAVARPDVGGEHRQLAEGGRRRRSRAPRASP